MLSAGFLAIIKITEEKMVNIDYCRREIGNLPYVIRQMYMYVNLRFVMYRVLKIFSLLTIS